MLKSLTPPLALFASLAILASCAKEADSPRLQETGETVTATFQVSAPDPVATKAIADGAAAKDFYFAVYDEAGNYLEGLSKTTTNGGAATIEGTSSPWKVTIPVVKDMTYQFVFLAKSASGNGFCTFTPASATIALDYSMLPANNDNADFFYVKDKITIEDSFSKTETMTRPLAQINIGASDLVAAGYSIKTDETMLTGISLTGINNTLNVLDGSLSGAADVELAKATRVNEASQFVTGYDRIAMAYVLAGASQTSNVTINISAQGLQNTTPHAITRSVPNIPLQGNYRTNILGKIFTSDFTFTVQTEAEFYTPEYIEQAGMTIDKANTAFANGQTSVTIDTDPETAGAGSPTTIILPATNDPVRIRLNFTTTQTISIQYADGAADIQKPSALELFAKNVSAVVADLPSTTVTVSAGSLITTGTFATAPTTLIIENNAEVTNLKIKAGNVKLEKGSKVNSIARADGNADEKTIVEVEGGLASYPSLEGGAIEFKKNITGVTIEKTETKATYSVSAEAIPETALEAIVADNNSEPKKDVVVEVAPGSEIQWECKYSDERTMVASDNTVTETIVIEGTGMGSAFRATDNGVRGVQSGDGTIIFKNITIYDDTRYDAENGNNAWEFAYLEWKGKIRCENVVFADAIQIEGNDSEVEFINCKFIADGNAKRAENKQTDEYGVWISGCKSAVFENCDFTGFRGPKAHEAYGTEITEISFNNCTFHDLTKKPGIALGTLNAATKVSITNCTFTNCQPGDQKLYAYETDTPVANFDFVFVNNTVQIAEGISQTGNIYTITDDATASTVIATVYSNAKNLGYTEFTIHLPEGEFVLPTIVQQNITIHIDGTGESTVLSVSGASQAYHGCTVDFSNLKLVGDTDTDFMKNHGLYHIAKETYTNVTFTKFRFFYAPECTLNNCKFVQDAYDYAFCSYGTKTMVLNDCEISCVGKAAKIYGVDSNNPATVTFNRCLFACDGSARQSENKDWKAALEIDARLANNTHFTVNVNNTLNCTGFYTSENTAIAKTDANYQGTLYNVDNGSGSKIVVNIDGVQQTQAW